MNYHVTGSVRLAHTKERMRSSSAPRAWGAIRAWRSTCWAPDEIGQNIPFLETHDLTGALYDPNDGDIDPAQLTQALAKGARDMGARIERFCPVTAARWTARMGALDAQGRHPLRICGERRRLPRRRGRAKCSAAGADDGDEPPVHPVRRDPRTGGLVEGGRATSCRCCATWTVPTTCGRRRRHQPRPLRAQLPRALGDARRPDARGFFSFQLFPDDLERLEWYLERRDGAGADPGTAGLLQGHQRPDPLYARRQPADRPDAGRAECLRGLRLHLRHLPGRRRGQGAGRMGDRRARPNGTCGPATRAASPAAAAPDYCVAKGMEVYGHEYAMHFPRHAWPEGRGPQAVAVHDRIAALGAQFGALQWLGAGAVVCRPGDDTSEGGQQTWGREGPWEAHQGGMSRRCAMACGILDLPGFSRLRLTGPGRARMAGQADHRPAAEAGAAGAGLFRR
jgi:dimethylglycine dehydrogenase